MIYIFLDQRNIEINPYLEKMYTWVKSISLFFLRENAKTLFAPNSAM